MENLSLNNCNNKTKELNIWDLIENIDWYNITKNKHSNPNDMVADYLIQNLTLDEIIKSFNKIVNLRYKMQGFIIGYAKSNKDFQISDDGIWDLASHIVGLGYKVYNLVFDNPEMLPILNKSKKENFEYGFDKAIYEIQYASIPTEMNNDFENN